MKLSIVTINYNNAKGLLRTIESVISQTFKEFEYILIDGGSTDGSNDIIDRYREKINYVVSEKDNGIYDAMNKGLGRASGEYLMFLNSGDALYNSNTFQKLIPHLDGTDIVYGNVIACYPGGKEQLQKNDQDITLITFLDRERHLCHQSVFMTKNAIMTAGGKFDESLKIVADWKLFSNSIFKHHATLKYVDETISFFEMDGISLRPASFEVVQKEKERVLKEDFPLLYKDFKKIHDMGYSFSEIFNSRYVKFVLRLRKIFARR